MADPVVEIVTYRLVAGTDPATHILHAQATGAGIAARPGFRLRHLIVDGEGLWSDHIVWDTMSAAAIAAETIMEAEGFPAFAADIDPGSVTMRHGALQMSLAKAP